MKIDTYELTQEDIDKQERGPKNWHQQFWAAIFMKFLKIGRTDVQQECIDT